MLNTERLDFKLFTAEDRYFLYTLNNNKKVNRYSTYDSFSMERTIKTLTEWENRFGNDPIFNTYKLVLKETDEAIGFIALIPSSDNRTAEIAYRLFPQHWRKGYCSESLNVLIQAAFETSELDKMFIETDPENEPSIQLAYNLKFADYEVEDPHSGKMFYLDRAMYEQL